MELEPGEDLCVSMADLKDAFYQFSFPPCWRMFFGLRPIIKASLLGLTHLGGVPIPPKAMVFPRLTVIPMAWTRCLWWCQTLHERIVETAGCSPESRLRNRKPTPLASSVHTKYVDNLIALGPSQYDVTNPATKAAEALRESGLIVHEQVS